MVGDFEVLDLWLLDFAEADVAVIGAEDVLKAFHEATEVLAVKLSCEYSAVGGDERLEFARFAMGKRNEIFWHCSYVVSMVLAQVEFG